MTEKELFEKYGPQYPEMGPGVAKFRRLAAKAGSIASMDKADRQAYGAAVEAAIRAKQRAALVPPSPQLEGPPKDIGAVIRAKHRAALAAWPAQERRSRSPEKWQEMYEAAMAEKARRS